MFTERNKLEVLTYLSPPYKVVLGAPHHVTMNDNDICIYTEKREGDINAGLLAYEVFNNLKTLGVPSKLVVKTKALFSDPNKYSYTDYFMEVFKEKGSMLMEIHGASSSAQLPLEISAGSNTITRLTKLGLFLYEEMRQLQKRYLIKYIYAFGIQEVGLDDNAILFLPSGSVKRGVLNLPALKTLTLSEAVKYSMQAVHIESKPKFRYDYYGDMTEDGKLLGKAVANSLYKYFVDKSFTD